jgi:protein-glutamine gamma-glutamyltransferase
MKFLVTYRISLYLMLTLASLVLSVDAAQTNSFALLFPPAVAVACVFALTTVDRNPGVGLSRDLANWLAFCSLGLAILEYSVDSNQLVMALGHWLVYLALIQVFLPVKTARDDWYMFMLSLVQVLIGGYISQSDRMGLLLAAWALCALWTLGLSHLHREAARNRPAASPGLALSKPASKSRSATKEPYPGLFDRAFYWSATRVAATTLALGGAIFLVMPRWESKGNSLQSPTAPKHLTGFTEEVQLGQIGEILENDTVVLDVQLVDEDGRVVQSELEPLWRGVVMQTYEKGRWIRQPTIAFDPRNLPSDRRLMVGQKDRGQILVQKFSIQATDSDALFSLRPVLSATTANSDRLSMNKLDGTLFRRDLRPGTGYAEEASTSANFEYEVRSLIQGSRIQPGEPYPDLKTTYKLLEVPDEILARLRAFAKPIVDQLPPKARSSKKEVAEALQNHLLYSGKFTYTLKMTVTNPQIDPVIDFLENRKQGHCAYYASALALLLRSQGIPARLVNGFKGGDWNLIGQVTTVREKHAHSWVEALINEVPREALFTDDPKPDPDWLTLDPTPGNERDASIARVGGGSGRMRSLTDYVRYIWAFYIVGFNYDRQQKLIYEPIKQLATEAIRGFRLMGQGLRGLLTWIGDFRDLRDFFSVKGFFVSVFVMLLIVGFLRLAYRLARRMWLRRHGKGEDGSTFGTGVAIYNRLARLLEGLGLERTPAETPREFARRASVLLAARETETDGLAEVPPVIVDAFYRIRFGHEELSSEFLQTLESRLDSLESSLQPQPG